ncbi:MFS transporter [Alicyclobacillus fastidiosus]|uniref:MFS transporter n=1 Tax=Alicyclobacillus fastidiosus TaxID=392011 RepID=A0ABV5A9Q5_9BACL|nr:MFS transporter [Alicyclobacillus fastidiosus]WEH10904.1 MFS transporter [Alicyclobacillus fastidiosus]
MATIAQNVLTQLDDSQVRRHHVRLFSLAAAGIFVDGYDLNVISAALINLVPSLHPSSLETSWLSTSALIGTALGAVFLGRLTDVIGRKKMFVIDLIFFVLFALASGFAPNMTWVIIFRFLLGIGIGADYPIAASYVSEIIPRRRRGAFLAATVGMLSVGSIVANLVSIFILSVDHGPSAWRFILASGAVPALIAIIMRSAMPESPRWLLAKNREQSARSSLQQIGFSNVTALPIQNLNRKYPYWKLFSPQFLRITILVTMSWLLFDILAYGVGIFQPILLEGLGFHSGIPALLGNLAINMIGFAGMLLAIATIERVGRKWQQIIGMIGMGLGLFLVGIMSAHGTTGLPVGALLAVFGLYSLSDNWGPSATTYTSPAELYPTSLRAGGHGLAAMSGKVGAAIGTFFLPLVKQAVGVSDLMYLLAGVAVLGAIVSIAFGVETKGGQSLETIEDKIVGIRTEPISRQQTNLQL